MKKRNPEKTNQEQPQTELNPRERLLAAGLEIFASHGFAGASTRSLAHKAQVNLAAINYYFGGKEGLYLATVEFIAQQQQTYMKPMLSKAGTLLDNPKATDQDLKKMLAEIISQLGKIVGHPRSELWAHIILREQISPAQGFQTIYEKAVLPIHQTCAEILARLTGLLPEHPEILARVHALVGQGLMFLIARGTILERWQEQTFTPQRIELIQDIIVQHTAAILNALNKGD